MITILVIGGVLSLIYVSKFYSLVRKKNEVDKAFYGMNVQLKKRYDLIPDLVATVNQYAKHEHDTLTEISNLRIQAMQANLSNNKKVDLNNGISKSVSYMMMTMESYPYLKANEHFIYLEHKLKGIESQIAVARKTYNYVVKNYNTAIRKFPCCFLAKRLGYTRKIIFVNTEEKREIINVKYLFAN